MVDASVGGINANSFCDEDELLAFALTKPSVLTYPTEEEATALLLEGTRLIENALGGEIDPDRALAEGRTIAFGWTGAPADAMQALSWPRTGMRNRNGVAIPADVIPDGLKAALCETALALRSADLAATNAVVVQGIASLTAGPVSVSFRESAAAMARPATLPDAAYGHLVPSWYMTVVASGFSFETT